MTLVKLDPNRYGLMKTQGVRPSQALARHRDESRRVVARYRATNPRVFGSVLRGTDSEDSDLDLIVDPAA